MKKNKWRFSVVLSSSYDPLYNGEEEAYLDSHRDKNGGTL
jgi:hypothetical protein